MKRGKELGREKRLKRLLILRKIKIAVLVERRKLREEEGGVEVMMDREEVAEEKTEKNNNTPNLF